MGLDNVNSEMLIARLSWRPEYILESMISVREAIQPSTIHPPLQSSPVGCLDCLPTELLHWVLNTLDFQSLSRFARTCHRAKAVVESLPAYRDCTKHASTALIALARTELITFHSAALIYAALRSEDCVSCQNYGPFLFLPTCERCCYECLRCAQSLRVMSHRTAEICFGVSSKDLRRIPAMLSIPGTYSVGHHETRRQRVKLVSLKQAKQLGVAIHGSEEAMDRFVASRNAGKLTTRQFYTVPWLTAPSSLTRFSHVSVFKSCANTPNDRFCGMASAVFPSLHSNGATENGLWCFGCRINSEHHSYTTRLAMAFEVLTPGMNPIEVLLALERQARSKFEFIEHVRHCESARDLLGKVGQDARAWLNGGTQTRTCFPLIKQLAT